MEQVFFLVSISVTFSVLKKKKSDHHHLVVSEITSESPQTLLYSALLLITAQL